MTTTTDTTADGPPTPPADTVAPVVQEPAAEPATDDSAATEQPEQLDTEHTTEAEETDDAEQDTDPRLSKARQEAKGLRSRLRDAELEVGLHRATLAAMQEAAAAQLAAGRGALADGADLFKAGVQVGDLLAADGTVDAAKVADAVAGVLADRPHWGWQPHKPAGRPREDGTSLMGPTTALAMAKIRDETGSNRPLLGSGTYTDGTTPMQRMIRGVPVLVSAAIPANTAWAVDSSRTWMVVRSDASILVDGSVFFTSDRVAVRATMRCGFAFPHPQSVIKITTV